MAAVEAQSTSTAAALQQTSLDGYPPTDKEDTISSAVSSTATTTTTAPVTKHRPPPIDTTAAQNASPGQITPTSVTPRTPRASRYDRERKIGHRRVDDEGQITYKKIQTSQIMGSIQLGIGHAVGKLASKPERDLLMQDFTVVETTVFPSEGSSHTPAHHYTDFRFKTYAPVAFRYFKDLFGIQPDDFLLSLCNEPLTELTNPGASGSIFYLTADDEFIIKTVQHKEGEFLQKLLPGYYMNLNQNPRTLLPKFFGLYCYQCGGKNVRLAVMNNLLPSIKMHQRYDLKGSTYKRKANKYERSKTSPTYKDLDFMEHHPDGLLLEADTYQAMIKTIQRDCRVLESFKIMDYSLLVGIHNLDLFAKERREKRQQQIKKEATLDGFDHNALDDGEFEEPGSGVGGSGSGLARSRSINRQRLVAHSTALEAIQADSEPIDEDEDVPQGGIPARNSKGERLVLFLGIIDILQSYRLKKKLEHTWKAMLHDGDSVSVHRPGFYAQRFQDFMAKSVFKKIPSPLKHSPSRKKSLSMRQRPPSMEEEGKFDEREEVAVNDFAGVIKADAPVSSTPPPSFEEALREGKSVKSRSSTDPMYPSNLTKPVSSGGVVSSNTDKADVISISHVTLKTESTMSTQSIFSESSTTSSGFSSTVRTCTWTPPHSVEGSTPTHTEGTPSFTESSSSGDLGCPTTPVRTGPTSAAKDVNKSGSLPLDAMPRNKPYQETEM